MAGSIFGNTVHPPRERLPFGGKAVAGFGKFPGNGGGPFGFRLQPLAGKALRFRRRDGQRLTFAGGRFGLFRKQRTAPRFRNAEPPDVPGGAARRTQQPYGEHVPSHGPLRIRRRAPTPPCDTNTASQAGSAVHSGGFHGGWKRSARH